MWKRMSKVICKLSVFRITRTWWQSVSGLNLLFILRKKTKTKTMWMFKHMQCPSFDKTCSNAPMDGLRPFLVTVDDSPCVSTPLSRPKPPRYACPAAWAWREKPVRGWGEGSGAQQWGSLVLLLLGATSTGSRRGYFALFFFCLPPPVASTCVLSPIRLCWPLAEAVWPCGRVTGAVSVPPVLLLESILASESIHRASPAKYSQQLSKKQILAAWKDYGKAVVFGLCGCS